MHQISIILESLRNGSLERCSTEQAMRHSCDNYNRESGNLKGYDCPKCKNRGDFMLISNGREMIQKCECMEIRNSIKHIKTSGLGDLFVDCTFETFTTEKEWQKSILLAARQYVFDHTRHWWYAGGQVGSGKTHICTAIVGEFIKMGIPARYLLWRDVSTRLKALVNHDEEYEKAIRPYKEIPVLYIDDLFKTEQGKNPTTADINLAFEILNCRYNNKRLITLISSELSINALLDIDEAVGSRIYQRTKKYCFVIPEDLDNNYRLECM